MGKKGNTFVNKQRIMQFMPKKVRMVPNFFQKYIF